MSFKQLNLDRLRIQDCISDFYGDKSTIMTKRNDSLWVARRIVDNKEMLLHCYYLNDGRTTLTYSVGKNHEASKLLAMHIKENALVDSRHNIYLSFKDFKPASLDEMISYLSFVPDVKLAEDRTNPSGQRILKFLGHQHDIITLTYHVNRTLQIQGRPVTLYCQIIAFLSEYLSLGDIIESQSKFVPVPIRISDIEYELQAKMACAYDRVDLTTRKMLGTAIAFTKIDIDLPDYTAFAFPALRALEGHIKTLFFNKGIQINREGFGLHFYYNSTKHTLKIDTTRLINCANTCTAIEISYNYYNAHRHRLFHAEVVPLGSSIIEDRRQASDIIQSVISIIEDSYRILFP